MTMYRQIIADLLNQLAIDKDQQIDIMSGSSLPFCSDDKLNEIISHIKSEYEEKRAEDEMRERH